MKSVQFTPKRQIGVGGLTISKLGKKYVNQVLASNRLSYGPFSQRFESEFAKEHSVKFASFMNSGTDALRIGLAAMKARFGWKDGDEVIVPAVTFVATANVVLQNNMKPVFVDVDSRTYNINPEKIEEKISKKTKAIIPVHLMGLPCEMDPIWIISKKYGLKILEDSCETMFATYKGKKVGSLGDIGAFSTYVAHFLETGVGGLTTTSDPDLATDIKSLMNHGRDPAYLKIDDDRERDENELYDVVRKRFSFVRLGYSSRCTEMEAALGLAHLKEKEKIILGRRKIAERYTEGLKDIEEYLQLPFEPKDMTHMYMLYPIVLRRGSKQKLVNFLEKRNIETRELMPILNQPIYIKMFGNLEDQYPVAKWINQSGFYIGCHQFLARAEQDYVIDQIHAYFTSIKKT